MAFDRQFGRGSEAFAAGLVKELETRQRSKATKAVIGALAGSKATKAVIGALAGAIASFFLVGWVIFLTYNAFRPDAWPYLGLWTAYGALFVFNYAINRARGA